MCANVRQCAPRRTPCEGEDLRRLGGCSSVYYYPNAAHISHSPPRTPHRPRPAPRNSHTTTAGHSETVTKRLARVKSRARPPRRLPSSPSVVRALDSRPITRRPSPFPAPLGAVNQYVVVLAVAQSYRIMQQGTGRHAAHGQGQTQSEPGRPKTRDHKRSAHPPAKIFTTPPTLAPLGLLWYLPPREPRPGIRFPRDSCLRKNARADRLPN
jgi:hypothetical protein